MLPPLFLLKWNRSDLRRVLLVTDMEKMIQLRKRSAMMLCYTYNSTREKPEKPGKMSHCQRRKSMKSGTLLPSFLNAEDGIKQKQA